MCAAVHPKTGRVCVPIDPARVREFDPFVVPTLGQLARQIDHYDKEHGEEVSVGIQFHAFGRRFALEREVPCRTTIIYRLNGTHTTRFVMCTIRVLAYRVLSCVVCRCGGHPTVSTVQDGYSLTVMLSWLMTSVLMILSPIPPGCLFSVHVQRRQLLCEYHSPTWH